MEDNKYYLSPTDKKYYTYQELKHLDPEGLGWTPIAVIKLEAYQKLTKDFWGVCTAAKMYKENIKLWTITCAVLTFIIMLLLFLLFFKV